jgi:2-keto-4-pentenoate hydratase/2-oxohepta-3-ene-1,7-dioic acid hydratase in catechol pathway
VGNRQEVLVKLVSYVGADGPGVGILEGQSVKPIDAEDMFQLVSMSSDDLQDLGSSSDPTGAVSASEIDMLAPLRPHKNIFAIGKNYIEHVRELPGADATAEPPPEFPIVFSKPPSSVIGPGQSIDTSNDPSLTTDYEGELAVVIGKQGKRIEPSDAMGHIFGYTIINDVTSRAFQRNHGQWLMGKGPDTFCPMGPCIVTADEVADVTALTIQTRVNGEVRQRGSLADLVFDIPTLIATISSVMTLEPGDVIATGTPSGVGAGFDPPRYLNPGDLVEITVDAIGTLSNPVV